MDYWKQEGYDSEEQFREEHDECPYCGSVMKEYRHREEAWGKPVYYMTRECPKCD